MRDMLLISQYKTITVPMGAVLLRIMQAPDGSHPYEIIAKGLTYGGTSASMACYETEEQANEQMAEAINAYTQGSLTYRFIYCNKSFRRTH